MKGKDVFVSHLMLYASAPLISIMIDQQSNFSPLGLKTEFVGEAQSRKDLEKKVMEGEVQLIYISPEMYSQEFEVPKNAHFRSLREKSCSPCE